MTEQSVAKRCKFCGSQVRDNIATADPYDYECLGCKAKLRWMDLVDVEEVVEVEQ